MTETGWDLDSPPARTQRGSGLGPGSGGQECLEASLGNAPSVCPFGCLFGHIAFAYFGFHIFNKHV